MQGPAENSKPKGILKHGSPSSHSAIRKGKVVTGRKSAKLKAKKPFKSTNKQFEKIILKKTAGYVGGAAPDAKSQIMEKKKFQPKKGMKRKFEGGKGEERKSENKKAAIQELSYKERKLVRRKTKNNYELSTRAKKIWEVVRDAKCKDEKRKELITELMEIVKGKVADLAFAHDTVRVIQCCVQYGTEEQRKVIFEEIRERVVELCKSKFGKHYVIKMLRYGTKEQKHHIIASFYGKVCHLVKNKDAAEVVEESYNNFANAEERSALMEEFYGPRFALFKESGVHTLGEILQKNPEHKQSIMEHMIKLLTPLIEKSVVKHSIVHKALLEFMTHANNAMRLELIATLRDVVVQILHTQDGSKVAMYALWYGSTKDRKIIMKSFKALLKKICMEEFGHRVLFALFDCVDDTKLVNKAIITEILKISKELMENSCGKKVLLYILKPRNSSHFHPDIVKLLERGDSNPYSKKSKDIRQKEILEAASAPLIKLVADNALDFAFDKSKSQLALAILQYASGDKREAYEAIADITAEDFIPIFTDSANVLKDMHIVEHPSGHLLIKRLLLHEKEIDPESLRFSDVLINAVPAANLQGWTRVNRGTLVLLSLFENGTESTRQHIARSLDMKQLAKLGTKGAEALKNKLVEAGH